MRRAFTLVEILVVVAILAVVAAIVFPAFARSKKAANIAQDMAQMRQTYLALKLYEEDRGEMPPNLTILVPSYLPKEILRGAGDSWSIGRDGRYAGIASCIASWDGSCPRVDYPVSYPYLKTFERRFNAGTTFAVLESRPEIGLLAALHHADNESGTPARRSDTDPSEGATFTSGIFLRTRMDGSTKAMRVKGWGVTNGCSWEACFLF